jgi:excisionase family DNA binding protein
MNEDARNESAWTVEKVAEYCGVHVQTVYTWARERQIPHFKIGRVIRFRPDEVRSWFEARRATPAEEPAA